MSTHWKKVIVPTDFSEASVKAAHEAARLAGAGAEITLVHVVEPAFEGLRIQTSDLHAEARRRSEEHLRQFAREHLGPGTHARTLILEGRPAEAVCDAAAAAGADLIVISNQGHSALSHALLGSVTERVVRHARCAVLVLR